MIDGREERWFYCLRCERAWSARAWQQADWACPSTAGDAWPQVHPHIGWSYLRDAVGVEAPAEGARYRLEVVPGRVIPLLS